MSLLVRAACQEFILTHIIIIFKLILEFTSSPFYQQNQNIAEKPVVNNYMPSALWLIVHTSLTSKNTKFNLHDCSCRKEFIYTITMKENKTMLCLTCLQWFSNTIRQVSGSAVHGLDGAACRPVRVPGPLGFKRLSQLILAHRLIQISSKGQKGKNKGERGKRKCGEGEKREKRKGGGVRQLTKGVQISRNEESSLKK